MCRNKPFMKIVAIEKKFSTTFVFIINFYTDLNGLEFVGFASFEIDLILYCVTLENSPCHFIHSAALLNNQFRRRLGDI